MSDIFLGFDGGGTKTECCALDAEGHVAGQGTSGPSNPLRAGYAAALEALRASAEQALTSGHAHSNIRGVCAALAGAGRPSVAQLMLKEIASVWPRAAVRVISDVEAALAAAVGDGPGVVLVAGTGSVALGRNRRGEMARAGGYGPWIGDFGSAYDIGRRCALAAARARDLSGPETILGARILGALGLKEWDDVVEAAALGADKIFPKLFPVAISAAESGDEVAQLILREAALELSKLAVTVIGVLGMREQEFPLALSGGAFQRAALIDSRVAELIHRVASNAAIGSLRDSPALAAARLALGTGLQTLKGS